MHQQRRPQLFRPQPQVVRKKKKICNVYLVLVSVVMICLSMMAVALRTLSSAAATSEGGGDEVERISPGRRPQRQKQWTTKNAETKPKKDKQQGGAKDDKNDEFAVVGYLPEWRYAGANFETLCEHLTHLLLFSLEPLPNGGVGALDRLPGNDVMKEIQDAAAAATTAGVNTTATTKILICFGGNGRSAGFSKMVQSSTARSKFVSNVVKLCKKFGFSGVDYNWEYPGYSFGRGYHSQEQIDADYRGLALLVAETRTAFDQSNVENLNTVTMAYYPDSTQERLLMKYGISEHVDLMHSMSYDQSGGHHSSLAYGKKTADQALEAGMPAHKVTMGLPFYGRYLRGGDWVTYEDIVQKHDPLPPNLDEVNDEHGRKLVFNGRNTIREKALYAKKLGLGGVMIWEAGQDCRLKAVTRHGQTHVVTCPAGRSSSLLVSITEASLHKSSDDDGMQTEL